MDRHLWNEKPARELQAGDFVMIKDEIAWSPRIIRHVTPTSDGKIQLGYWTPENHDARYIFEPDHLVECL